MNIPKKVTLLVGLVVCGVAALFPPRHFVAGYTLDSSPTPCFIFSPSFQKFSAGDNEHGPWFAVAADGGKLLAELSLVAAVTGIVFLLQSDNKK
jgi:hypothetical protein